jgi:5-methylcytosine-specific restriction endonuclease McrA
MPYRDKEKRLAYCRAYYKEYFKTWKRKTPQRKNHFEWMKRHPLKDAEYGKRYRAKHRDRVTIKARAKNAKRRAIQRAAKHERIDYLAILRESEGLCGICAKPLDLFGTEFDHIIPLSRGGSHTRDNIQLAHAYCNRLKGARIA